jgi:hypothetical protein
MFMLGPTLQHIKLVSGHFPWNKAGQPGHTHLVPTVKKEWSDVSTYLHDVVLI